MTYERKKILIVEDDPLLAMDLEQALEDHSVSVVATALTSSEALAILGSMEVDFALLDYNLGSETSAPVAVLLTEKGIPFVYLTGQSPEVIYADGSPKADIIAKTASLEIIINHIRSK